MEFRYCKKCFMKIDHELIEDPDITARKGKALYRCTKCKLKSWKRHLRPSAEISY